MRVIECYRNNKVVLKIEYNQGSELQDYLENTYSTIYSVLQELKGSDKK